eukprot:11160427-Lingulodinium_polyedra.AAC.1
MPQACALCCDAFAISQAIRHAFNTVVVLVPANSVFRCNQLFNVAVSRTTQLTTFVDPSFCSWRLPPTW